MKFNKRKKSKKIKKSPKLIKKINQNKSPFASILNSYYDTNIEKQITYTPKWKHNKKNNLFVFWIPLETLKNKTKMNKLYRKFPSLRKNSEFRDYLMNLPSNDFCYLYDNSQHFWFASINNTNDEFRKDRYLN
jgi:hypothetical protein